MAYTDLQGSMSGPRKLSESSSPIYLTDVTILCTECQQPIKARINTQQWIRVEWIGPSGECRQCYNEKKTNATGSRT